MKKKILILGTGNAQVDAINLCRRIGAEVHGCSYRAGDPGEALLDAFVKLDIRDTSGVQMYVEQNNMDLVYSVGSDIAMPTAMAVSEALGLPHFVSAETARICNQKHVMRQSLSGIRGNLPFMTVQDQEELESVNFFPCMVKPVDAQGQRGCAMVNDKAQLAGCFQNAQEHSFSKKVIIEKYVDGPEISVNIYVVDGELAFFLVSDRITFSHLPGGIIKEHHLPSHFASPTAVRNIEALVCNVTKRLKIQNGPAYFQIKLEKDEPYLLEVTPRLDGCHMWNLITRYCGNDLLANSFLHLLFQEKPLNFQMMHNLESKKLVFLCEEPGKIFSRERYKIPENEYLCWYYQTGDTVRKLNGYMEKCGYYICR